MSPAALAALQEALLRISRAYESVFEESPTTADLSALISAALGTFFDRPIQATVSAAGEAPAGRPAVAIPSLQSPLVPRVGDVVALELGDGRFGVARVLRLIRRGYVVEILDGAFGSVPTLAQARSLPRLAESHGRFQGQALVRFVHDDPPSTARTIGRLLPSLAEYREEPRYLGDWSSLMKDILDSRR